MEVMEETYSPASISTAPTEVKKEASSSRSITMTPDRGREQPILEGVESVNPFSFCAADDRISKNSIPLSSSLLAPAGPLFPLPCISCRTPLDRARHVPRHSPLAPHGPGHAPRRHDCTPAGSPIATHDALAATASASSW